MPWGWEELASRTPLPAQALLQAAGTDLPTLGSPDLLQHTEAKSRRVTSGGNGLSPPESLLCSGPFTEAAPCLEPPRNSAISLSFSGPEGNYSMLAQVLVNPNVIIMTEKQFSVPGRVTFLHSSGPPTEAPSMRAQGYKLPTPLA